MDKDCPLKFIEFSYNNAAYIATSGINGMNSSRSSEISRDAIDLFK